jgi:hypothetical protein
VSSPSALCQTVVKLIKCLQISIIWIFHLKKWDVDQLYFVFENDDSFFYLPMFCSIFDNRTTYLYLRAKPKHLVQWIPISLIVHTSIKEFKQTYQQQLVGYHLVNLKGCKQRWGIFFNKGVIDVHIALGEHLKNSSKLWN